jgi:hypothetical protein
MDGFLLPYHMVASGDEKLTLEGIQKVFYTLKQASLQFRVEPIQKSRKATSGSAEMDQIKSDGHSRGHLP